MAVTHTRTIDDEQGDSTTGIRPIYSPPDGWSQGVSCNVCWVRPDASLAFQGTWHDTTYSPGNDRAITVQFTGTEVRVYNIIANTIPGPGSGPNPTTLTSLAFQLDGVTVDTYVHAPDPNRSDIQYQVLVFERTGLSNDDHTLVIQASGSDQSLVLFDYVEYTFDDGIDPPSTSTDTVTSVSVSTTTDTSTSTSITTTTTRVSNESELEPVTGTSSSPNIAPSLSTTPAPPPSSSPPSDLRGSPSVTTQATSPVDTTQTHDPSLPSTVTETAQSTVSVSANHIAQRGSDFPTAAVVGATLGGVLALVSLLLFLCFIRKHRRSRNPSPFPLAEPEKAGRDGLQRNTGNDAAALTVNGDKRQGQAHTPTSQTSLFGAEATSHNDDTFSNSEYSSDRIILNIPAQGYGFSTGGLDILRPLPDVSAPASSPTTDVGESRYTNLPSAAASPPGIVDEKSDLNALLPVRVPQFQLRASRTLPDPPSQSQSPRERSGSPSTSPTTHISVLRTQVAVLQEELERMREQQEMQQLLVDVPPTYDEARTGRA